MKNWTEINLKLVAKALGEMIFEETITPKLFEGKGELQIGESVHYSFTYTMSMWGWPQIDDQSLLRNGNSHFVASDFFIDTQEFTKMSDITLSQFIEEMRSTLYADMSYSNELTADDFTNLDYLKSQQILNGHPKIIMNKGRIGWSVSDWKQYAPENSPAFKVALLAIKTSLLDGELPNEKLYNQLLNQKSLHELKNNISFSEYTLIPVHPWQWDNIIQFHYQDEIQKNDIVYCGVSSFDFSPQTSLRTLNCLEDLANYEIKLPLSILNTSCIRGIPGKTIKLGTKISKALNQIIDNDLLLKNKVEVLGEVAGVHYCQSNIQGIKGAPYRFKEFLGAIWRESPYAKIKQDEQVILSANLLYCDQTGKTSLESFIEKSKLTTCEWIKEYTRTIIIPLLHLQKKYGVGLVAHGQNIMIILKNSRPHKLIIKDFQGDFRLNSTLSNESRNIFKDILDEVLRLPGQHLIHDLYTAHFVTLLRYVGMNAQKSGHINESDFYKYIAEELKDYEDKHTYGESLLKNEFEKILVNAVRFKIGYGDNAERPIPLLGTQIKNPLYKALQ